MKQEYNLIKILQLQKKNNYASRIVNVYIVYDLDNWPKNPLIIFCLFGGTNIVNNNHKEKYVYSGCGTAFEGKGGWKFGSDFARNFVLLGVDNSSSSHTDNIKNGFLILGEGDTFGINERFGAPDIN